LSSQGLGILISINASPSFTFVCVFDVKAQQSSSLIEESSGSEISRH
jgi:hypothetical protein